VKFGKKLYFVDLSNPLYNDNGRKVFLVDKDSGQISRKDLNKGKIKIDPEVLDSIVSKSIVRQLTDRMATGFNWNTLMPIIMGLGIGLFIGYLMGKMIPTAG